MDKIKIDQKVSELLKLLKSKVVSIKKLDITEDEFDITNLYLALRKYDEI